MLDFISDNLDFIKLYLPIGVIGAIRWFIWVEKKIVSLGYRPTQEKENNFCLSIVAAVYNEKPEIFERALDSWAFDLKKSDEIIAVIDHADQTSIKVFKEFAKLEKRAKLIITQKPGKRPALVDGFKISTGDIVAFADSDTIWHENIRKAALSPFLSS